MRSGQSFRSTISTLGSALLITTATVVIMPVPAQADVSPVQGIQFGHAINADSAGCERVGSFPLLFDRSQTLASTKWLRLDLRAAGGGAACTRDGAAAAYQSMLNEVMQRNANIKVIGLLSNDFVYGAGLGVDPQVFADAAGEAACRPEYAHVDVYEIWNEPDLPDTRLEPDRLART